MLIKSLPCALTIEEVRQKGEKLAQKIREYELTEEERKKATKQLGDKLKDLRAEQEQLGREIRTRKEDRDVEVREEPDNALRVVRVIRVDTGEEAYTRAMTETEIREHCQPSLFSVGKKAKA